MGKSVRCPAEVRECASEVGLAGRQVEVDRFDYRQYGAPLLSFFPSSAPETPRTLGGSHVTNALGEAPAVRTAIRRVHIAAAISLG